MLLTLPLALIAATAPVASCADGEAAASATSEVVAPAPAVAFDHAHATWTQVLATHVEGDRFDYGALKKKPEQLRAYLEALRAVTPKELAGWTRKQRYAFWINAYNAFTIKKVVDNYPLKSIRDLSGAFGLKSVFDDEFIDLQGHHPDGKKDKLSLNDIEHKILRPRFKDARVHAAINCASYSCPPLLNRAYTAADLDETLEAQMKGFVRDTKRNRWNADKKRFEHSEIFDWFSDDFKRDAGDVRSYLIRYATPDIAEKLRGAKLKSWSYDWSLNDVKKKG